jgi:hypothetical protein
MFQEGLHRICKQTIFGEVASADGIPGCDSRGLHAVSMPTPPLLKLCFETFMKKLSTQGLAQQTAHPNLE